MICVLMVSLSPAGQGAIPDNHNCKRPQVAETYWVSMEDTYTKNQWGNSFSQLPSGGWTCQTRTCHGTCQTHFHQHHQMGENPLHTAHNNIQYVTHVFIWTRTGGPFKLKYVKRFSIVIWAYNLDIPINIYVS